jgi:hypothetical protein
VKELYERYGELLVKAEIINNQIAECKRAIAEALNKPAPKEEAKGE